MRIDPGGRRAEYILRLEGLMAGLDAIIADPSGYEEIQVRAVNSLVSAVRMCYRMVVDVERLEAELERLREGFKPSEALATGSCVVLLLRLGSTFLV